MPAASPRRSPARPRRVLVPAVLAATALLAPSAAPARAQTYSFSTLVHFDGFNSGTDPRSGLTRDAAGNLYGTTNNGGVGSQGPGTGRGTVFKIAAGTDAFSLLYTFDGANTDEPGGLLPYGGVIPDGEGNLYGTTTAGGQFSQGTVFRIDAGTGTLTRLASLSSDARSSWATLTRDAGGNLYGVSSGNGRVFKVAAGTNALTTLASFGSNRATAGFDQEPSLTLGSDGNLYGSAGGTRSDPFRVFRVSPQGAVTTLASAGTSLGFSFGALLRDASGDLYGTTTRGGANDAGTIFKLAAGTNTLTTLYSFGGASGSLPRGGLIRDGAGNLYGTTYLGGMGGGAVFKLDPEGTFTSLHAFAGPDGSRPLGELALGDDGSLYGVTQEGGQFDHGTVFRLTPNAAAAAPEPGTLALCAPGAVGVLLAARRRRPWGRRGA